MISKMRADTLRWSFVAGLLIWCIILPGWLAVAQAVSSPVSRAKTSDVRLRRVSALMVSDFHFDPFHDPGKVQQLFDAPVSEWEGILDAPASANQEQAEAVLQHRCGPRVLDTSNALLQSSLRAMRVYASDVKFVTFSGDLIAHGFACRFASVVPGKTQSDYAGFVEKTMDYVMGELRKAEPGIPIYAALGNNDTGCGDYRMDAHSEFLAAAGKIILQGLPPSQERDRALEDFAAGGYYSVTMAAPMRKTRLIVLNDLFMSHNYAACDGKGDSTEANTEQAWLQKQLGEARRQGQRVWVMGHIPPGVDIYATAIKIKNVCDGNAAPEMFLTSEKLVEVLVANADVVRLGIFAHTHMDELRLLGPEDGARKATPKEMIAVKMVASISPVHGNKPTFTVAQIDTVSATLVDYEVFVASNETGSDASWSQEYSYSQAYHEAAFAPPELERLVSEFKADPDAKTAVSQAFIRYFYAQDNSSLIKPLWPEYVCALTHDTSQGFSDCVCPSVH